jgi:hypothetical protein
MHPFPPANELAFVLNAPSRLVQVAINATSLRLVFENGCHVDVALNLVYVRPDGTEIAYDVEWYREKPLEFHNLLEQDAVSLETEGLEMRIGFSGGGALRLFTDIGPYEAVAVVKRGGPEFYI